MDDVVDALCGPDWAEVESGVGYVCVEWYDGVPDDWFEASGVPWEM